jgi:hypothetical protein
MGKHSAAGQDAPRFSSMVRGHKGIPMRKWILRFGTGLGMILAGTSMSGCLWNQTPEHKPPSKTPSNNAFNNSNSTGNPSSSSGAGAGTLPGAGSPTNATRTSGMIGGDPARPAASANDPVFRNAAPNLTPVNGPGATGGLPSGNGAIQPVSATNMSTGPGTLTPIATSSNRGKPVSVTGVSPVDPTATKDMPAQLDPVPSMQPPAPVSFQNSDPKLQRYQPPSPPLMTNATEAQPIRAIDPVAKPQ